MRNLERERELLDILTLERQMSVHDLAARLGVSDATIRRDLQVMEEKGLLRRLHGGATLDGVSRVEPLFEDKEGINREAKMIIARAALDLIEDGDHIYLDGGSTIVFLARLLDRKRNLTIVTNSLSAAGTLVNTDHKVILLGGELRQISRTMVGPLTVPLIESLRVDKAFMGTIAVNVEDGMTTTDANEAFTKETIIKRADEVVLLADSSKFGDSSYAKSGSLESLNRIVTERMDTNTRKSFEDAGVNLTIVES